MLTLWFGATTKMKNGHFFFWQARQGKFTIVISSVTVRELVPAPSRIRKLTDSIPDEYLELAALIQVGDKLAQPYIKEGALTPQYESDAQHIATATI